jgi:hypothetical protein
MLFICRVYVEITSTSGCGGSASWSTSVACVRVCVVRVVSVAFGLLALGLGSMFLAVFLSLVIRRSCLVSDFVMGGVVL